MNKFWRDLIFFTGFLVGMFLWDFFVSRRLIKIIEEDRKNYKKLKKYYEFFNYWMYSNQHGVLISQWIKSQGFKKVIIYGMKEFGMRLYDELKSNDIDIVCCIDQNQENIIGEYPFIGLNDEIPEADIIIVTAIHHFQNIKEDLQKKVKYPILSLELVVNCSLGMQKKENNNL